MQMSLNSFLSAWVFDLNLINEKNAPSVLVLSLHVTAGDQVLFLFFLFFFVGGGSLRIEFQFKAVDLCVLLTRL